MRRGELYRVYKGSTRDAGSSTRDAGPSARDPKKSRVFVVVSRQILLDSRFPTATCAPVYSSYEGISTQVPLGIDDGLKHSSSIHCDELISILKSSLTDFIGTLSQPKTRALNSALSIALEL